MRDVVILRPEPAASRTADRAKAMGLVARKLPLFELVPIDWTAPETDRFDALLLTSANALRCGGPELEKVKHLPVHAVGPKTAEAAEAIGFTIASVGEGGLRGMSVPAGQRLLHLAGKDRIATDLVEAITVYESRILENPDASGLAGSIVIVHSPRAGRRLAELVKDRASIAIAAISTAAAEACGHGWERVEAAPQPDGGALLALAKRLCENQPA